jgi:colicin import membrane protein
MRVLWGLVLALSLSACGPKTMDARLRDAEKMADRASAHLDRAEKAAIQLEPREMESALDDAKDELGKKDIELYPEAQMHFDRYKELANKLPQVKAEREKRDLERRLNAARDKIVPRVQALLEAQEAVPANAPTRALVDTVESKAKAVKDAVDDELDLFVKDNDFAAWAKSQGNKVDKALESVARGKRGVAFLEGPVVAWKEGLALEAEAKNRKDLGDKETALRDSRTKLSACDRTAKPFDEDKATNSIAFVMPQGKPQTPAQLSTTCQQDLKRVETTWKKVLASVEKQKALKKSKEAAEAKARAAKEARERAARELKEKRRKK